MVDARPAVIARPVDAADVARAVQFARSEGLPVSVRGGGHSVAGHGVGPASVMIDLRLFREVQVDAASRIARVGGGACWNDVDAPTQAEKLAMPGGTYGDTGVAGLTLTGGIGHLIGVHGLTLDNLVHARLVSADGEMVEVDADREPDLFWALRGGGGNFGVVTEFGFALHPVYLMTGGVLGHTMEDAAAVIRIFRDMRATLPDELTLMPTITDLSAYGAAGTGLLTSVAYLGTPEQAAPWLAELRAVARPVFDRVGPIRYHQVQGLFGYTPFGLRHYWTSRFVEELNDAVIDFLVGVAAEPAPDPGAKLELLFEPVHGAASRVPVAATAFPFRSAAFNVSGLSIWNNPDSDAEMIARAGRVRDCLTPWSHGGYLNYSMDDVDRTLETTFGPALWARLQAVKRRWDPDNVFRFNHNIPVTENGSGDDVVG